LRSLKKKRAAFNIPKQHGAWISIFACFALGLIVAKRFDFKSLLLLISIVAGFLLRYNISESIKDFGKFKQLLFPILLYFLILAISGLTLLFYYRLIILIPLGVIPAVSAFSYLYFERIGKPTSTISEIIGMLGIATIAPAAYYVASKSFDIRAAGIWIVSLLFFICSVFIVRYLARNRLPRNTAEYIKSAKIPFSVCATSVILAYLLGKADFLPGYAFISIAPSLILFLLLSAAKKRFKIKTIGIVSTINITIFVILSAISFIS